MADQLTFSDSLSNAIPYHLIDFEAALTREQCQEGDTEDLARNRHLMLATLTRSGQQLLEGFRQGDNAEKLCATIEWIDEYQKHLETLTHLSECASARLMAVANVLLAEDEIRKEA